MIKYLITNLHRLRGELYLALLLNRHVLLLFPLYSPRRRRLRISCSKLIQFLILQPDFPRMGALQLPCLSNLCVRHCNLKTEQNKKLLGKIHYLDFSKPYSLKSIPELRLKTHNNRTGIRMQADGEDDPAKQIKEMAAARKRWEALIKEEKVKVLTPREAGYAIQLSNKTLLDVRPSTEHEKAWVKGSTWIPIFDVDNRFDVGTISRKITNFMMGGWWSGIPTLSYDREFISKVEENFPKDTDLIVACQRGLRSLAACEQLYNAGYRNLFWVQGGLEAAEDEDLEREGPQPFKFAAIGGVSEFLGWTDQQRAAAAEEGWGYRLIFSARLVGVILLADAVFIGVQKLGPFLQDLRSH